MRMTSRLLSVLLLAACVLAVPPADAARGDRARAWRVQASDVAVSRDRAAAVARSATGGRVLSVILRNGKRPSYRVKVLVNGRVRSVIVDARTGAIR